MKKFLAAIPEIIKLAAAIYANQLLREHVKLHFLPDPYEQVTEESLSLLMSAALVFALAQFVFARPVIKVMWRYKLLHEPVDGETLDYTFANGDPARFYEVKVFYDRPSVVAWVITWILVKAGFALRLTAKHSDALKFSKENAATGVRVRRTEVDFPLPKGNLENDLISWVMLGVKTERVPDGGMKVRLGYRIKFPQRPLAILRILIHIDASPRRISLNRTQ